MYLSFRGRNKHAMMTTRIVFTLVSDFIAVCRVAAPSYYGNFMARMNESDYTSVFLRKTNERRDVDTGRDWHANLSFYKILLAHLNVLQKVVVELNVSSLPL